MPSTFLSLHYHLVFSSKHRQPVIEVGWRSRLWDYLSGTVTGLGARPEVVGGTSDHIHLLIALRATHTLADFMRELKKASSLWVHDDIGNKDFAWQEGYAAFTVSASAIPDVRAYIETQEEHHRRRDFREELETLLTKSGVVFDARFLD